MADAEVNPNNSRASYFQQVVERMLIYWRDHEAVKTVDVDVLDRERHRILKNIALGLDLQPIWPLVKPLIVAFAPYMERRGHWKAWHGILEQAIHMAQRADDVDAETTLTAYLARLCQRMSQPVDVVRHYRRVIELARATANRFEEARACSNLGYLYIDGSRWWRSEVLSCHALAIFEELGSDHGRAHTYNHLGVLYVKQSRWNEAESNLLSACQIWQTNKDDHGLVYGYMNLGILYIEIQNPALVLETLQKAYDVAQSTGEVSSVAKIWSNMAIAYRQKMNWLEAERYARKAEKHLRAHGDKQALANVWQTLGIVYLHSGRDAAGVRYFSEALAMQRQLGNKNGEEGLRETINKLAALPRDEKTASLLRLLIADS